MPILALDKFGRIYETSPDRDDGKGYKSHPESVCQGDLTLGSAYLKANQRHSEDVLRIRREQKFLDEQDRRWEEEMRRRKLQESASRIIEARMLENSHILRENQLRQALSNGITSEYNTKMSGNAMSANGQMGYKGWSRDQQTIHHAMLPHIHKNNTAHAVDPIEAEQHRHRLSAHRVLMGRARR